MKTIELNTLGFIQEIKEHEEFKSFMLDYISNNDFPHIDNVSITDWEDCTNLDREYVSKLGELLAPYLTNIANKLRALDVQVPQIWFQRYLDNADHVWHYHPKSSWTAVYYIELPDEKVTTQLYDFTTEKIIDNIKLKEGELFVFSSNILHRSPPNLSGKPKTIISFNLDFDNVVIESING